MPRTVPEGKFGKREDYDHVMVDSEARFSSLLHTNDVTTFFPPRFSTHDEHFSRDDTTFPRDEPTFFS